MMRQRIQRQLYKMFAVLVGVFLLVAWRHEFVWTGITSNIYLNLTIISLFIFGLFLAFSSAMRLKNEELAFVALQEAYDDIKFEEERAKSAPFWRHYRCLEPGIVFARPLLLGHVFDLTYEKMMRSRDIKISIGTMQSLMVEFKTKVNEDRAMLAYLTGILVFLGLIGTFIGLMDMVGSVGGIIGSIANMDMSDPTAAFTKLITDLQAPLVGMATGFSSSLFGLFGSLLLGLQGRFLSEATGVIRGGLETMLSAMAEIDADHDEDELDHREAVLELLEGQHEQLASLNKSIQQLTQVSAQTALAQRDSLELLKEIAEVSGRQAPAPRVQASGGGSSVPSIDPELLVELNANLEDALGNGFAELGTGFADMSAAMETSFISYAQLLRQSMDMHRRAAHEKDEAELDARFEGKTG